MSDVFISYASPDKDVAEKVATGLRLRGISVWFATEILPGVSLRDEIYHQLSNAKAIIVIWSKNSQKSAFVSAEADYALQHRKYIGVLLDINYPEIPMGFGQFQHIIFQNVGYFFKALLESLSEYQVKPDQIEISRNTVPAKGFVFLSHAEEDLIFIASISEFLVKRKYAYWTYHEGERDYQKPTHLEIEERLVASDLMFSILSPDWKLSEWTFRELWFAREIRKPLFLLRFRNPGPTLAIAGDTYIDFERDQQDGFKRLGLELDKRGL